MPAKATSASRGRAFLIFTKRHDLGYEDGKEGILVPWNPPKFSEIRGLFRSSQFLEAVKTGQGSRGSEI